MSERENGTTAPSSQMMGPTAKQITDLTAWAREAMRFIDLSDADHDGYDDLHDDAETLTLAGYRLFGIDPESDEASIQKVQSSELNALAAFAKVTLDDFEVLRAASQELGNSFFDVATDKRTVVLDRLDALIKRLSLPAQPAPAEHVVVNKYVPDFRKLAVEIVDGIRGYTFEFSSHPAAHKDDYDFIEQKLRTALATATSEGGE